jgi:hypothetical protein
MSGSSKEIPLMECGSELLKRQFLFDSSYHNLNHGESTDHLYTYSSSLLRLVWFRPPPILIGSTLPTIGPPRERENSLRRVTNQWHVPSR